MSDSTTERLGPGPADPDKGSPTPAEPMTIGFAWFPAAEFPEALRRWPELADSWAVSDFVDYCRQLQEHMMRYADSAPPETALLTLRVTPIRLEVFLPWCAQRHLDPGEPSTRSQYAAERVRLAADDVVAWPPARNGRCWCGSNRKYKHCCGSVRLPLD